MEQWDFLDWMVNTSVRDRTLQLVIARLLDSSEDVDLLLKPLSRQRIHRKNEYFLIFPLQAGALDHPHHGRGGAGSFQEEAGAPHEQCESSS